MIDHFKTFGVGRTLRFDRAQLERRFYDLQQASHPDRHVSAASEQRTEALDESSRVNQAYRVLRDPAARLKHLLALCGFSVESSKSVPQSLLMTVMEVQEKLAELEYAPTAKNRIASELEPTTAVLENRIDAIDEEIENLSLRWDATTGASAAEGHLRDEERDILQKLSNLLAERAYINTLHQSIHAALSGKPAVIRH